MEKMEKMEKMNNITVKRGDLYAEMLICYNSSIAMLTQSMHPMFDDALRQLRKERRTLYKGNYNTYTGSYTVDFASTLAALRCSEDASNDIASDLVNEAYVAICNYQVADTKEYYTIQELYNAAYPTLSKYIYSWKKAWKSLAKKAMANVIILEDGTRIDVDEQYKVDQYYYYNRIERKTFKEIINEYMEKIDGSDPIDRKIIGRLLAGNVNLTEFCDRYGINSRRYNKRLEFIRSNILRIVNDVDVIVLDVVYNGQRQRVKTQLRTIIRDGCYYKGKAQLNVMRNKTLVMEKLNKKRG